MSGTILSGDGWFGKRPFKGLFCWYQVFVFVFVFFYALS